MKFQNLRKKYPRFIYEKYSYEIFNNNLKISFDFRIEPGIRFKPEVIIENIEKAKIKRIVDSTLNNFVFNLGLMEIPSYWKATCSPTIEIRAGFLTPEQKKWWKDLIIKGMGQFFFENKINFTSPNFLQIRTLHHQSIKNHQSQKSAIADFYDWGILVPVGGGKDSAVTLELLKKTKKDIQCFSLNPTNSALKIMKISGCRNPVIARRKIDEKLLELNRKGYLNGHTPFSAYLAFLSTLVATILGKKYIALSNERSSNEGNVKYLGRIINHQWSKSFEFEEMFRRYSKKYLAKNVEYFSFLRPFYEIQIAKLFAKYPKYFPVFLSCNEAYKTASGTKKPFKKWCGKCSKCLFTFAILYPFVREKELLKIFRKNLFEDKELLPIMQRLVGEKGFKPFECVGTKKESLVAFFLSEYKFMRSQVFVFNKNKRTPFLLKYFKEKILPKYPSLEKESEKILNSWDRKNNLPKDFEKLLKKYY